MSIELKKHLICDVRNLSDKNEASKQEAEEEKEEKGIVPELEQPTAETEAKLEGAMKFLAIQGQFKFVSKSTLNEQYIGKGVSKYNFDGNNVTVYRNDSDVRIQVVSKDAVDVKNIYGKISGGKIISLGPDNDTETDTDNGVNGELDEWIKQGGTGDCWLITGVLALNSTAEGKLIIKESIQSNSDGSVTVTFKGLNVSYTITASEIKKYDTDRNLGDKYSNGDNDMLALELAVVKLKKDIASGKVKLPLSDDTHEGDRDVSIEGGFAQQMIYFLTGKASDTHIVETDDRMSDFAIQKALAKGIPAEEIYEVLQNASENMPIVLTFGVYYSIKTATLTNGNKYTLDVRSCGHALAITNVDAINRTVTFVNPWDSTESFTMTWEEFAGMGIGMLTSTQLDKVEEPTPEEPVTPDEPVNPDEPIVPEEPVIPNEPVVPNSDVDISGLEKWSDEIDFTVITNLNDKINIRKFDSKECFESFELIREQIVEYIKNKLDAMGLKYNDETINKVLNRIFSQNCGLYLFKENSLKTMLEKIMSKVDEAINNSRKILCTNNTTKISFVNVVLDRYVDSDLVNTNGFYLTEEEKELKDIMLRVYGNHIASSYINNEEDKELNINEAIHEMDIFSVHLRKYFKQIGLLGYKLSDDEIEEILKETKTKVIDTFYFGKNNVSEKTIIMHFVAWANSSAQTKLGYEDSINGRDIN